LLEIIPPLNSYEDVTQQLHSDDGPTVRNALAELPRAIVETWSISCHCTVIDFDCILSKELASRDRRVVAIALIRAVVDTDAEKSLASDYGPRIYVLFDDVLSQDIYKLVSAESSDQSFEKRGKLNGLFDQLNLEFEDIDQRFRRMEQFDAYRRSISAFFNAPLASGLLPPFLPRNLTQGRLQEFFTQVTTYTEQDSVRSISAYDMVIASIREFRDDLASVTDNYGLKFVSTIASHIEEIIREEFEASPLSKSATIQAAESTKKYPLDQTGHDFKFSFSVENKGPGFASAVEVAYIPSTGFEPINEQVVVGDLAPNQSILVSLPIRVSGESGDRKESPTVTVGVTWHNLDGGSNEVHFDLPLRQQKQGIDWDNLATHNPYSLVPVITSDELIGRREQMSRLASLLHGSSVGNAVVSGHKRVGKTSVARTFQAVQSVDTEHPASIVFIEAGEFQHPDPKITVDQMVDAMHQKIVLSVPQAAQLLPPSTNGALSAISGFLDALAAQPYSPKVIFIFDEFDSLPYELFQRGGNDSQAFFSSLRAISNKQKYGFVLVGGETMRLVVDQSGERLNLFEPIQLNHIDRERNWDDFKQLVERPAEGLLEFSDDALSVMYESTAGHPYFTKMICRSLFAEAVRHRDTSITRVEVLNAYRSVVSETTAIAFQHFWTDGLLDIGDRQTATTLVRKAVLLSLADCFRTNQVTNEDNMASASLRYQVDPIEFSTELRDFRTRQILDQTDGVYSCRIPMFQDWLVSVGPEHIVTSSVDPDAISRVLEDDAKHRVSIAEATEVVEPWGDYQGRELTPSDVMNWLSQFGDFRNQRSMFNLLKRLRFFRDSEVRSYLRDAHRYFVQYLDDVVLKESNTRRRDIVVSYLGGEGKSGATFATLYRIENRIFNQLFVPPQLLRSYLERHTDVTAVVFVDDFVGTGRTAVNSLRTTVVDSKLAELMENRGIFLGIAAVACTERAFKTVQNFLDKLPIESRLYSGETLVDSDQAFSEEFDWATEEERLFAKTVAEDEGRKLERQHPLGYSNSEALVVFQTNCPNNTLPVIWKKNRDWSPLFERAT
jgi:hypothetical protein